MASVGFIWLLLLVAIAGWLVAVAILPWLTGVLTQRLAVDNQRRRLWLLAGLPLLLPVVMLMSLSVLAAGKKLGWFHDHCLSHAPHHPHFCLEHLPQMLVGYPQVALMVLVGGLLAVTALRLFHREYRQARHTRTLVQFAHGQRRLRIVETDQVLAFAAGLLRPRIFLSRGLLRRLSKRQCRIVLAHEVAHLRRRDLWLNLFFELLLLLHLPAMGSRLRQRWWQAVESNADENVANRFGVTEVAGTLLTLVKTGAQPPQPVSALGADPLQRIRRLLDVEPVPRAGLFEGCYGILLGGLAIILIVTHHWLETLLGFVVNMP